MELGKNDLIRGRKFIVGLWKPEFVVNFFSRDLKRVPASEFKSEAGDLTALSFEFFADNTFCVRLSDGREEKGKWSQTDLNEYEWEFEATAEREDEKFLRSFRKLTAVDGFLTFSVGFLSFALKKDE